MPSSGCFPRSCTAVHGFVHVVGSSIVTRYSIVFGPVRVQRSIRCKLSVDPRKSVFPLKLVTSTTRVLPSKWARESPHQRRTDGGRCGEPSTGIVRCHPCPCPV